MTDTGRRGRQGSSGRASRAGRWPRPVVALGAGVAAVAGLAATAPITERDGRSVPVPVVLAEPGPALRTAVDALDRGERHLADALLRAIGERHPEVADHVDLLRMRLRVEAGDDAGAIAFEPRWSQRDSPLRGRFYTLLGRAFAHRGDEPRARAAWEYAALTTEDHERLAQLELDIAESYLREGDRERAAERLLAVWTRYPELDVADVADEHLDRLAAVLGRTLRTAQGYRRRGDQLFRRHHNEEALAAYERALVLGLDRAARRRAAHQRAETLFRLRRYRESIDAFRELPETAERSIQIARAYARTGRVAEGARQLEALGARRGPSAVRAQYLAALLWDGENELERARGLYASVIRRAPRSSYAGAARWRLGWEAYRAGRLSEATGYFADLARIESDPVAALRPRYWQIRADEALGDTDAPARYAALAREYPLTYYGWRALRRADGQVAERPAPVVQPGTRALRPEELARPRILLEAGLVEEARDELVALFRRARGVDDRLALAQLYADAGDYHRAQRLVVDAYGERLARGPDPGHLELWWHAWPDPYPEALRAATRDGSPEPALVYSIMREESGYRPDVISASGARGLLQLMPETADRLARSVEGGGVDPDDLFDPDLNIRLGSAYLGQLLQRFDGRASAAIGSYNAGPQAVARWLRERGAADDVWVEEIPYSQTRAYVKRVLRSLHAYRVLY